jgi:hypothetical protein
VILQQVPRRTPRSSTRDRDTSQAEILIVHTVGVLAVFTLLGWATARMLWHVQYLFVAGAFVLVEGGRLF